MVPDTLSKEILYNQSAVEKHFPKLRLDSLHKAIEQRVENEIMEYLGDCGLLQDYKDDVT